MADRRVLDRLLDLARGAGRSVSTIWIDHNLYERAWREMYQEYVENGKWSGNVQLTPSFGFRLRGLLIRSRQHRAVHA